jgi:hypothetical protein
VALFTQLTKKDQPFSWGVEVVNVFQSLKASFMTATLLIHPDLSKPFVLETEISDFVVGDMLSQLGKNNLLHLVDFCFCKFSLMEINYDIHDTFFFNHHGAFEEWCHLLNELNMKSLCIHTIRTCSIS